MYCTHGVTTADRALRHQFPLPLSRPPADVTPLITMLANNATRRSELERRCATTNHMVLSGMVL